MKKSGMKIVVLVAAVTSMSSILFAASEGYQDSGIQETQDVSDNCPSSCTYQAWTHYGCIDGGSGQCTPYNDPANPPTVSGTCTLQGGVYYCSASS